MADRVVIYHDLDGGDPEFDLHITHLSGTPIVGGERTAVLARLRQALDDQGPDLGEAREVLEQAVACRLARPPRPLPAALERAADAYIRAEQLNAW